MSEALLQGAYDLHVHAAPDTMQRRFDTVQLVRHCAAAGMAGVLLKGHFVPTTGRAQAAQALVANFDVASSVVLNRSVGGINPVAVEAALNEGAQFVFLPTLHASAHVRQRSAIPLLADGAPGVEVLGENGRLRREVHEVIDLVASRDAVLATGHISPLEADAVIREAISRGVRRVVATHVSSSLVDVPIDLQRMWADLGVCLEHCYVNTLPRPDRRTVEEIAAQVRAVRPGSCLFTSDLGQAANPPPAEGLGEFLHQLVAAGIAEEEVRRGVVALPAELLH